MGKEDGRERFHQAAKVFAPIMVLLGTFTLVLGGVLTATGAGQLFGVSLQTIVALGMVLFVVGAAAVVLRHEDQTRAFEELIWNRHRRWLDDRGITWSESAYSQWLGKGDFEVLGHFWDGGAQDVRRTTDQNDLHVAAHSGGAPIVDRLVERGVAVNKQDYRGYTPLMCAAEQGNVIFLTRLLYHHADADIRSHKGGFTALHIAIIQSRLPVIDALLEHHVNLDLPDDGGVVPLMAALASNRLEIARKLIAAGADLKRRDSLGATMMDYALLSSSQEGHAEVVAQLAAKGVTHAQPPLAASGSGSGGGRVQVQWVPAVEFVQSQEKMLEQDWRRNPYYDSIKKLTAPQGPSSQASPPPSKPGL